MFSAFFFVVVVPYVFVGGVVPILSLMGCALICFIKNPSLVIVSPGNMNGVFFLLWWFRFLLLFLFCSENLWWVLFLFIFWALLKVRRLEHLVFF